MGLTKQQRDAAYYQANRELIDARTRTRREANREVYNGYMRAYHRRHPEQARARKAVRTELRAGRLTRGPCAVCGSPATQAHHYLGYAEAHRLDIVWLCRTHHSQAHRAPVDSAHQRAEGY
jgi:hypothetical protein